MYDVLCLSLQLACDHRYGLNFSLIVFLHLELDYTHLAQWDIGIYFYCLYFKRDLLNASLGATIAHFIRHEWSFYYCSCAMC